MVILKTITTLILSISLLGILLTLIFSESVIKDISNENMDFHRGYNAFNSQRYSLAQKYFSNDLLINPKRPKSLYMAARSYMKGSFQDFNKSIEYYREYIHLISDQSKIDLPLILQLKGVGMQEDLDWLSHKIDNQLYLAALWEGVDSIKALNHINLVPKSEHKLKFHLMASRVNFALQNYETAIKHANLANDLSGMNKNNYYILSQAYRNLKNFNEAKKSLQNFELLNSIYTEVDSQKQFDYLTLLLDYNQNLKYSDDFKSLNIILLIKLSKFEQVQNELKKIQINALNKQNRLLILGTIKNMKAYLIANRLFDDMQPEILTIEEYVLYCQTFIQSNLLNKALNLCRKGIEVNAHSAPIHFWYGIALLKSNNITDAQLHIKNAINHAPWVNPWIIQLSKLYLLEGKVQMAKSVLEKSIDQDKTIQNFKLSNYLY